MPDQNDQKVTAAERAAADKQAADKAATAAKAEDQKTGALTGAQAVAAAVTKVANAAVAEVQKTPAHLLDTDLLASGAAGGKIRVIAAKKETGFGSGGTLRLNGTPVFTNGWSTLSIEGVLPADAKSGVVEVEVDPETIRRGHLQL